MKAKCKYCILVHFKIILKMKNFIYTLLFVFGVAVFASAQKVAVVDIAYLLENMNEYQQAQNELDKIAEEWQQEIAMEHDKIKSMYNKYQAELVLMTDEMKTERENEIMEKEKEVRDMQRDRFGPEGALFQKRQSLVSPIQEKVFAAIQDFASTRDYDIIFDKGGTSGVIFSNETFDKTDDILRILKN